MIDKFLVKVLMLPHWFITTFLRSFILWVGMFSARVLALILAGSPLIYMCFFGGCTCQQGHPPTPSDETHMMVSLVFLVVAGIYAWWTIYTIEEKEGLHPRSHDY